MRGGGNPILQGGVKWVRRDYIDLFRKAEYWQREESDVWVGECPVKQSLVCGCPMARSKIVE